MSLASCTYLQTELEALIGDRAESPRRGILLHLHTLPCPYYCLSKVFSPLYCIFFHPGLLPLAFTASCFPLLSDLF